MTGSENRQCAGRGYSENFEQYKTYLNKVARYDLGMFRLPQDATILDVGCAFGDRIRMLRDRGHTSVYGVEIDPYCVESAGDPRISVGSITDTKLQPSTMDVVLVENVFHHISDYAGALNEISRVLKPGGSLCFIEPRNSIARRLLDFVTFQTPVPAILRGPWACRKRVMGEEIETGLYPLWLKSHSQFFKLLNHGFEIDWLKKNSWFYFCKAHQRERMKSRAA